MARVPREVMQIGSPCDVDQGVVLGYAPERRVPTVALKIGANARLRSGTIIYAGSTFGEGLQTGHNVLIREENHFGNDVSVWSNTVVDYGCRLGNRVKIHSNVYIPQFTEMGDDVFVGPGCTFANDMYPGCPDAKDVMKGPVLETGAKIGVNVTILPGVRIGAHSIIGSGAVVTKDIPPFSVAWGNPALVHKSIHDINCCDGSPGCEHTAARLGVHIQ